MIGRRSLRMGVVVVAATLLATLAWRSSVGATSSGPAARESEKSEKLTAAQSSSSRANVASATPNVLQTRWRSAAISPVSAVSVVDGVPVLYALQDKQLTLVGLNAATGQLLWSRIASIGDSPTGIAVGVESVDQRVVFLDPETPAHVIVADPHTGADVANASNQAPFVSRPSACDDDPKTVCATTIHHRDNVTTRWRINATTGVMTVEPDPTTGQDRAKFDDDVYGYYSGQPQHVARITGTTVQWRVDIPATFGGGADTANGWDFQRFGAGGAFLVGTMNQGWTTISANHAQFPFSGSVTAGIDYASGRVLWQAVGTAIDCGSVLTVQASDGARVPLLCRYRGVIDQTRTAVGAPTVTTTPGLDVTIERVDPATGAVVWSFDAGADRELTMAGDAPRNVQLDDDHVLVPTKTSGVTRLTAIDLGTGKPRLLDTRDRLWCEQSINYSPDPWTYDTLNSRGLFSYCDGALTAEATLPDRLPQALPSAVRTELTVNSQALQLVASPSGVVAYA